MRSLKIPIRSGKVWASVVMLVMGVGLLGWRAARQRSATPRAAMGIASDGGKGHTLASPEQSGAVNAGGLNSRLQNSLFAPMPAMQTDKTFAPDPATRACVAANYGKLPLQFESNAGQTDKRVKFVSRGKGYTLFLTDKAEAVLTLSPTRKSQTSPKTQAHSPKITLASSASLASTSSVLRMTLVGANPKPQVIGAAELPGKVNYFIGNDPSKWRTNVATYAKARYHDVYPGIDLVYYGNRQGRLEHDFVIAPGADPTQIAFSITSCSNDFNRSRGVGRRGKEGINSSLPRTSCSNDFNRSGRSPRMEKRGKEGINSSLQVDASGNLVLHTSGGDLTFQKPIAYQETETGRKEVKARYAMLSTSDTSNQSQIANPKSKIGFVVGAYDKSLPLIIDPVLSYSTYLGGWGSDVGFGIAVDGAGDAYVTGETWSTDFPTANPLQTKGGAFVAKLNVAGSVLVYSTYLGGSDYDAGLGIAVDGAGNVYVTGSTSSTDFPTANPLQAKYRGGGDDAFVAKIGSSSSNPAPTVTSITPNSGVNNAPVSITNLAGTGFLAGATVKLTMTGQPDISGTTVSVVSSTQITCTFDLTGKATGLWNVVVTNPDNQSATLPNGFTINTAPVSTHDVALTVFTASPNPVSRGSTVSFSVTVKNLGTYTENGVTFTLSYGSIRLAGPIKLSNWKAGQEMSGVLKLMVPRNQKVGDYLITGQLSIVSGETNTTNNSQTVKVTVK